MKIGAVVMASGEAKRFGGNKLLVPFRGRPMISYILRALPIALSPALVVTRDEGVKALAERMGFEVCMHDFPDVSDTIRLGLSAMEKADGCAFFVADQPLLTTETIARMTEIFDKHRDCMVRVCFDGREGNPVLFPRALFPELRALEKGQSGGLVVSRHPELLLRVQAGSAAELMDIDTRESLARFSALAP